MYFNEVLPFAVFYGYCEPFLRQYWMPKSVSAALRAIEVSGIMVSSARAWRLLFHGGLFWRLLSSLNKQHSMGTLESYLRSRYQNMCIFCLHIRERVDRKLMVTNRCLLSRSHVKTTMIWRSYLTWLNWCLAILCCVLGFLSSVFNPPLLLFVLIEERLCPGIQSYSGQLLWILKSEKSIQNRTIPSMRWGKMVGNSIEVFCPWRGQLPYFILDSRCCTVSSMCALCSQPLFLFCANFVWTTEFIDSIKAIVGNDNLGLVAQS